MNEIERLAAAGMDALGAGDHSAAADYFREITMRNPGHHQAWNALAWARLYGGEPAEAAAHVRRALEIERRNVEYLNTLGVAQGELGEFDAAEATFRKALKFKPGYVEAILNLGKILLKQRRIADTVRAYELAYSIAPETPKLAITLAHVYRKAGRAANAKALLESAWKADEEFTMQMAEAELELGEHVAAVARLREAIAAHPDWVQVRVQLAHTRLAAGEWREGWAQFVFHRLERRPGTFVLPALPSKLEGSRILLRGEQGIGDVLFFLRFAAALRERGASLTIACEAKLHPLLRGPLLEAVRLPAADDGQAAGFGARIWLGDLPAVMAADSSPPAWPLWVAEADKGRARELLASLGPAPYLGVTWRGGTDVLRGKEFGGDKTLLMKEVPPQQLGAALRGWKGTVVSLQRLPRPGEREMLASAAACVVHDLSHLNEELVANLAIVSLLDEYAGVSNANMHLLAGTGRTARVLVPYPAEWRWARAGASPWFPGFTVYREPQARGWSEPLAALRRDLIG
jgi:Flp pilus assembly protein TadD